MSGGWVRLEVTTAEDLASARRELLELVARIRAVLRRARGELSQPEQLRIGELEIDFSTARVLYHESFDDTDADTGYQPFSWSNSEYGVHMMQFDIGDGFVRRPAVSRDLKGTHLKLMPGRFHAARRLALGHFGLILFAGLLEIGPDQPGAYLGEDDASADGAP